MGLEPTYFVHMNRSTVHSTHVSVTRLVQASPYSGSSRSVILVCWNRSIVRRYGPGKTARRLPGDIQGNPDTGGRSSIPGSGIPALLKALHRPSSPPYSVQVDPLNPGK
jgi:hypothetical protein